MKNAASVRNIVFVAGIHGNERAPVRALDGAGIPFVLGSPRAYDRNVRFTERDLNASFGRRGKDYEALRAKQLLAEIPASALVVDFHTTTAKTSPFAIVTDKKMLPFAMTAGVAYVVLMTHSIKAGRALINYRDGISIESGSHGTADSRRTTLRVIRAINKGKRRKVAVFEVYGRIEKPGTYVNFKKHRDGFFPVLAGEKSYDFPGLMARRIRQ